MDNKEFDIERFEELVKQIKEEYPELDIEFCKYIAGSYLMYDVMKLKRPIDNTNETVEVEA